MTVMSTNTRELDINTLVLTAYQYAGVMNEMQTAEGPQWDARSTYGRKQLEVIIDALPGAGVFERSMETYDLAVSAGSASTAMPVDTIDVRGSAKLLQDDDSEFDLAPLSRQQYADITIKDVQSTPSKFYLARTAPMFLFLWPVPEADCTIRLQRQRLTFDNSSGSATVDLERFWMDYLLNELAARVAISNGMPMDRTAILTAKSSAALSQARGKASSQLPNRIVMGHRTPWSR